MKSIDRDNISAGRDDAVDDLFKDLQLEGVATVELPSGGRFYSNKVATLNVRPLNYSDEKDIAVSIKQRTNVVNLILSKCIEGLPIHELLLVDKLVILLKIREISYGSEFKAEISCPSCGEVSQVTINLANLIINKIPMEVDDIRSVALPRLKKEAKVRFLRVSDEPFMKSPEAFYTNLWRFVVSIDGKTDPVFINKVIQRLPAMDVQYIIKELHREDIGLDPRFIYECNMCGTDSEMGVPITDNFFSVT